MSMHQELKDFVNSFGAGFAIGDRIVHRRQQDERDRLDKIRLGIGYEDDPEYQKIMRQISATGGSAAAVPTYAGGGEVQRLEDAVPLPPPEPLWTPQGDIIRANVIDDIRRRRAANMSPRIGAPDEPPPVTTDEVRAADYADAVRNLRGRPAASPVSVRATAPALPAGNYTPRNRMLESIAIGQPDKDATQYKDVPVTSPGNTGATGGAASPGGSAVSAPSMPGSSAPTSASATGGTRQRKALNDQTRTEAFDPTDPRDMAEADLATRKMIHDGMVYATGLFDLNGQDPRGKQAFVQGVGQPDHQTMQAVDQTVMKAVPDDYSGPLGKAKLQLRRMEIIYRWAMQNGRTEQANKMAFEIMQYSAGAAAQYGQQAVAAARAGNIPAATQAVAHALDEVPDGYKVTAGPNGTISYYDANGQQLRTLQMTPEQLFNTAMGLSNKSLYWQVLAERAKMAPAAQKDIAAERRAQLDESRLETEKLKREDLKSRIAHRGAKGGKGAAVASPIADILTGIREKFTGGGGTVGPTHSTPPQGGGEPPQSRDDDDDE